MDVTNDSEVEDMVGRPERVSHLRRNEMLSDG